MRLSPRIAFAGEDSHRKGGANRHHISQCDEHAAIIGQDFNPQALWSIQVLWSHVPGELVRDLGDQLAWGELESRRRVCVLDPVQVCREPLPHGDAGERFSGNPDDEAVSLARKVAGQKADQGGR